MGKSIDEIISAIDHAFEMYISEFDGCSGFDREETDQDRKEAAELIKSQQAEIERLKEQGKKKFLVDETGKITPLPIVTRCKDCCRGQPYPLKARMTWCNRLLEPHKDDWFCAYGLKDGDGDGLLPR